MAIKKGQKVEAFLFNKDNPRDLCLWCRHSVCSNNTSSPLHAFVRVSGQSLWIHQPPFSAARVNSRSWTWVSPLSVKTSDQWTRCLKQSQVNTLYHHNLLTNTPLPLPLAWLSHSTPSPLLCLHPSLHLSILSHCLVMLSVRARMCHSWRELLSTTGAQLSSVSFFVFVCLFEGCDGG